LRRKKIIIGIHGAGNKPPQPLTKLWWRKAICEGLARIGYPRRMFKLELVYWAKFLYSEPQRIDEQDSDSPLFISSPYVPAASNNLHKSRRLIRKKLLDGLEIIMDRMMLSENRLFNFDRLGDYVIRKKFRDLELYYHGGDLKFDEIGLHARRLIRKELAKVLKKHRKKDILLIAHSMGSVIAYDVLTQLVPDVPIHTLVTIGSPLGLPAILKKIFAEQHKDLKADRMAAAPESIRHAWVNFADLKDTIALNYSLSNDFKPNSRGVGPSDVVVENDYEYQGKKNPHKTFGYLRTPEVARVIHEFLTEKKRLSLETVTARIGGVFRNLGKSRNASQAIMG
ncbi:MAG: hypothetical protein ACE5G1_13060, partial [bacterium]